MNRGDKQDIIYGVYIKSMLEKKVYIPITQIGNNIEEVLTKKINNVFSGMCISEGFVKPDSAILIKHSSGIIQNEDIEFVVLFECMVAHPVEGQIIECTSKTITKAGIHAHVIDGEHIPVHVFIAKDHHTKDDHFNSIKEDMSLKVKIIGIRFELNDPHICAIGKLLDKENEIIRIPKKKR